MKKTKVVLLAALILLCPFIGHAGRLGRDCKIKGIALHGKVKVVDKFADLKVKVASNFYDLKVKKMNQYGYSCGQWFFGGVGKPDFTIEYVDRFEDLTIKYVDSYPGVSY